MSYLYEYEANDVKTDMKIENTRGRKHDLRIFYDDEDISDILVTTTLINDDEVNNIGGDVWKIEIDEDTNAVITANNNDSFIIWNDQSYDVLKMLAKALTLMASVTDVNERDMASEAIWYETFMEDDTYYLRF